MGEEGAALKAHSEALRRWLVAVSLKLVQLIAHAACSSLALSHRPET